MVEMRRFCFCYLILALIAGVLAFTPAAHAGPYEEALPGFTTDDFSDTADSINAVVASANPLAAPLIAALQDGRLMFSAKDKKVFIKTADDKLTDAETGKPVDGAGPDDVDVV